MIIGLFLLIALVLLARVGWKGATERADYDTASTVCFAVSLIGGTLAVVLFVVMVGTVLTSAVNCYNSGNVTSEETYNHIFGE